MTPANLTTMDWLRAALAQAVHENLTPADLLACAEHASGPVAFADAVNILATMKEAKP